jgi:hypothetical protein
MGSGYSSVPIPRIKWSEYTKEKFHAEFVVKNLPCVIEGAFDDWPALTKWQDPEYVINTVGADKKYDVEIVVRIPTLTNTRPKFFRR